jgi:hypothetical protein
MVCGQRQTFGITLYSPKQSNETAVLWLKIIQQTLTKLPIFWYNENLLLIMTKQQSLNAFISVF